MQGEPACVRVFCGAEGGAAIRVQRPARSQGLRVGRPALQQ